MQRRKEQSLPRTIINNPRNHEKNKLNGAKFLKALVYDSIDCKLKTQD